MNNNRYKFAIIGVGPRGGYALECLIKALAIDHSPSKVSIKLFEERGPIGSGPVYNPDQPISNWVNITDRALELAARPIIRFGSITIPEFMSYHQWAGLEFDTWPVDRPDAFPPRSSIGDYLHERCLSLVRPLEDAGIVQLFIARVDGIQLSEKGCKVIAQSGGEYYADNVLITVGHQPTQEDPQSKKWSQTARKFPQVEYHAEPYPVDNLTLQAESSGIKRVALRGFGLAMIDVARALGERFGSFEYSDVEHNGIIYVSDAGELEMAPFSLDGMPMGPKPYTPLIDVQYTPSGEDVEALRSALCDRDAQKRASGTAFLTDLMVPIIAKMYRKLKRSYLEEPADVEDVEKAVLSWLNDPELEHKLIMPTTGHPADALQRLIDMAMDETPIYLDYCAGQVWRHCQPTIYESLSYSALSNEVMAKIIKLDEQSKRYSFGPPVESLMQLRALYEAGALNLDVLNNPDITLDDQGWTLTTHKDVFSAATMINTVLDGPNINDITSPLLASLLHKDFIQPAHDELGVLTDDFGYVLSGRDKSVLPIALLGRIAKGTVIGVDAILECFGERPIRWANAAVKKLKHSDPNI